MDRILVGTDTSSRAQRAVDEMFGVVTGPVPLAAQRAGRQGDVARPARGRSLRLQRRGCRAERRSRAASDLSSVLLQVAVGIPAYVVAALLTTAAAGEGD